MTATRRSILSDLGATLVPVPAVAAAHPDAELLALGDDLVAAWREEVAEDDRVVAAFDAGEIDGKECDRLMSLTPYPDPELIERIAATPAHTVEGLRVHALALAWCQGGVSATFEGCTSREGRLAWQARRTIALLGAST